MDGGGNPSGAACPSPEGCHISNASRDTVIGAAIVIVLLFVGSFFWRRAHAPEAVWQCPEDEQCEDGRADAGI